MAAYAQSRLRSVTILGAQPYGQSMELFRQLFRGGVEAWLAAIEQMAGSPMPREHRRRLLRNEPYRLLTTEKPEEAVTWVLETRARVVIADQRMPGMSGLELLELVRNCSPSTARVMLSGQTDLTGILTRSRLEAIDRLVRKPWDGDELRDTLRTLVARV